MAWRALRWGKKHVCVRGRSDVNVLNFSTDRVLGVLTTGGEGTKITQLKFRRMELKKV